MNGLYCALIFCASNLYLDLGVGYVDAVPPVPQWAIHKFGPGTYRRFDMNQVANPRGHVSIGHEWNGERSRVSLELRHESWIGTNADKGENAVWFNVRMFPFKPIK